MDSAHVMTYALHFRPSEDDKKALCQLLGKLHIPDILDDDKLRTLKLLTHNLRSVGVTLNCTLGFLSSH